MRGSVIKVGGGQARRVRRGSGELGGGIVSDGGRLIERIVIGGDAVVGVENIAHDLNAEGIRGDHQVDPVGRVAKSIGAVVGGGSDRPFFNDFREQAICGVRAVLVPGGAVRHHLSHHRRHDLDSSLVIDAHRLAGVIVPDDLALRRSVGTGRLLQGQRVIMSVTGVGGRQPVLDGGGFEGRPGEIGQGGARIGRELLRIPVKGIAFLATAGVGVQGVERGVGGNLPGAKIGPIQAAVGIQLGVKFLAAVRQRDPRHAIKHSGQGPGEIMGRIEGCCSVGRGDGVQCLAPEGIVSHRRSDSGGVSDAGQLGIGIVTKGNTRSVRSANAGDHLGERHIIMMNGERCAVGRHHVGEIIIGIVGKIDRIPHRIRAFGHVKNASPSGAAVIHHPIGDRAPVLVMQNDGRHRAGGDSFGNPEVVAVIHITDIGTGGEGKRGPPAGGQGQIHYRVRHIQFRKRQPRG